MALGETEVRERLDPGIDRLGQLPGDPLGGHPGEQLLADPFDLLHPARRTHRPAQQIGLVAGAVAEHHRHLHQLLLEQRYAQGALQDRFQQRVRIADRLLAGGPAHIGMHRTALDRAGPDQGDLDDQVIEPARQQPGQGADLGPALHLEHPDRIGHAEHVVDPGLLLGDPGQGPPFAEPVGDQIEGVLDRGQDAQAEEVELHQPHPGAGILVPLQHGAVLHPAAFDRADLTHRAFGEHHATGVDAEMARGAEQLLGQLEHRGGDLVAARRRRAVGCGEVTIGVDLGGPGVLLAG